MGMSTLLSVLLLVSSSVAADWPEDGDVVVQREIAATPAAIHDHLRNLENHPSLWPEGCSSEWEFGNTTTDVGANALVTYQAGVWRRKLTVVLVGHDEQRVKLDHPGNRGFVMTYSLSPTAAGTQVEMHTWINPPPKPFTGFYFKRTYPKWLVCHEGVLENLGRALMN